MRSRLAVVGLSAMLVVGTAATAVAQDDVTTLRVARLPDFIPIIHPVQVGTGNQEIMANLLFSNLVSVASDEVTILPDAAASWDVSPDATVYTFTLDERARWQDGEPLTTQDVLYTICWAAQNPDAYKQLGIASWLAVKGSAAVKGLTGLDNCPEGLNVIDERTIEITLDTPNSVWLRNVTNNPYFILPYHLLKDLTAAEAETCEWCVGTPGVTIGSGPYKITKALDDGGGEFEADPTYWQLDGKPVDIDKIVYRIQEPAVTIAQLEAGELDLAIRVPADAFERLSNVPGLVAEIGEGVGIFSLAFNNTSIADPRIRRAIAYAIDRPAIINTILQGQAKENFCGLPPAFPLTPEMDQCTFDPEAAKALLAEAAWDPERVFRISYPQDSSQFAIVMPVIQQYLQDVGIKVELIGEDSTAFIARLDQPDTWDAYGSFGGSEGVSWARSEEYYACNAGSNYMQIPEAECTYSDMFKNVASKGVPADFDAALNELGTKLSQDVRQVYLWQPAYLHAYTDRLGGGFIIYPNERESFETVEGWTMAPAP